MKSTGSGHAGSFGLGRLALAAAVALSCAAPAGEVQAGSRTRPWLAGGGGSLYDVEVLLDGGPAPRFHHGGELYVLGQVGRRYTLRVWNRTARRVEAVVSVDGRDVVDGKPGDYRNKRGYLVPAHGFVDIDGWRLDESRAAAFRFTSVANSYAARVGSARNVGVIGVAVFPEMPRRVIAPPPPPYWGHRNRDLESAPAEPSSPAVENESRDSVGGAAPAPSASASRGESAREGRSSAPESKAKGRPGLGTEFGESVGSEVREVHFLRQSSHTPEVVLALRYNDRPGLLALGIDVDGRRWRREDDARLRHDANPFPVSHRSYASPPSGWSE